jgi:hypothetical protein
MRGRRLARTLLLTAFVVLASPLSALAQSPAPEGDGGPNVWGNMPGVIVVLIPLAIGVALYLSYVLGGGRSSEPEAGRQGAVSRALARREDADA